MFALVLTGDAADNAEQECVQIKKEQGPSVGEIPQAKQPNRLKRFTTFYSI